MRRDARRSRQRVAGTLLGLFVLGGLLPDVAMAQYNDEARRVARRTSRRTANRQETMQDAATPNTAVAAVPAGAQYVTALPAGCVATTVGAVAYQQCGSVRYRPYYQGQALVYVVE